MTIVYKADPIRGAEWKTLLAERAPEIPFHIWPDLGDPADFTYLVAWEPPKDLLRSFPNLKIVFSVGAGVDHLDLSTIPEAVSVVRMVEPGLVGGMVEYATMAVLAAHRNLIDYIDQQRHAIWRSHRVRPAANKRVGVMGLGVLGQAVLRALLPFGFRLSAWRRSPHIMDGVECHAGAAALPGFLAGCDILACLVPLTAETRGMLNADLFAALPAGSTVINVGRGGHLVEGDLLAALENGHLSGAILDVFGEEPLPADHPFWRHPRILMTPHIASMTQPETAVGVVLENIRRHQRGEKLTDTIDRRRGY